MQAILSTAKHYYRCWLLTKHAFPSLSVQADVAAKVYAESGGDPENTEPRTGETLTPLPFQTLIGTSAKEPKMRLVSLPRYLSSTVDLFPFQIMNEGATYRGVVKNYARDIVVMAYGLHLNVSDEDAAPSLEVQAQYVRERVAALTTDCAWLMVRVPALLPVFLADMPNRTKAGLSGTQHSSSLYTRHFFGDMHQHRAKNPCSTRSLLQRLPSVALP